MKQLQNEDNKRNSKQIIKSNNFDNELRSIRFKRYTYLIKSEAENEVEN